MSNHTQGDWKATHFGVYVDRPGTFGLPAGRSEIADCVLGPERQPDMPREEQTANIALIAVAPKLETALQQIAAMLKDGETDADGDEFILENDDAVESLHLAISLARDALAKVEGRT